MANSLELSPAAQQKADSLRTQALGIIKARTPEDTDTTMPGPIVLGRASLAQDQYGIHVFIDTTTAPGSMDTGMSLAAGYDDEGRLVEADITVRGERGGGFVKEVRGQHLTGFLGYMLDELEKEAVAQKV